MSEEDLKIVRELFDRAKENFERDGYLAPVLFAWASGLLVVIYKVPDLVIEKSTFMVIKNPQLWSWKMPHSWTRG